MLPIVSASVEPRCSVITQSDGDLFPCAWADDGALYAANGDGKGFDLSAEWCDIVVNRIDGGIGGLRGVRLTGQEGVGSVFADPAHYNRKPTGMACVDGVLYLAVQNLNKDPGQFGFDDVPYATICRSDDKGKTWTWDREKPMFDGYRFTTLMFLDYGKNYENCPDDYVLAYGMDDNWRASISGKVRDPQELYLARVRRDQIMNREAWTFFCGMEGDSPLFSKDIGLRKPVLTDTRRVLVTPPEGKGSPKLSMSVISQGSVVYNKPLGRYLYTSWTENTFEFYEAPAPWGPFRLFLSYDFGFYPWTEERYGGYATVIPSKFISEDGKTMYVQSNTFVGGTHKYAFNLRKLTVETGEAR